MRPIETEHYRTLAAAPEEAVSTEVAMALVRDPEIWLPPTEPVALFHAWQAVLIREDRIDHAVRLLGPEGHGQQQASDLVRMRGMALLGVPLDGPGSEEGALLRAAFEAVMRDRAADSDFNPFRLPEANEFAAASLDGMTVDALASRAEGLRRMQLTADVYHSYVGALPGSFWSVPRDAMAETALAVLAAIGEQEMATSGALAEAKRQAGEQAIVEAEARARAAEEEAQARREAEQRAAQERADGDREADEARQTLAMMRAIRPAA